MKKGPVREYKTIIDDSGTSQYVNRVFRATPTTGLVRIEWVQATYGQIIPANWSQVIMNQFMNAYIPLRYQVDDAQNMIAREFINNDFEWLLMIEHDTLLPPDGFIRFNEYIRREDTPVVSGLYYTRSRPSEPLVYRGLGTSCYTKWEQGDLVWVDGVPTGALLVHRAILQALWDESPEYIIEGPSPQVTRRVFESPRHVWFDPESNKFNTTTGTSDLAWCKRIMQEDIFRKAGWADYADKEYPFLIDTNIFCRHVNPDGEQFP